MTDESLKALRDDLIVKLSMKRILPEKVERLWKMADKIAADRIIAQPTRNEYEIYEEVTTELMAFVRYWL